MVRPSPFGTDVVDAEVLAAMVEVAVDGLALVDGNGRYVSVNPAGCRILGVDLADLVGGPAVFRDGGRLARWCRPGSQRERDLEFRTSPVRLPTGEARVVAFRDVTELRQQQRRSIAFATAAANVAEGESLRGTLDAICAEVVRTTDLAAAQILLLDVTGDRLQVHGAAPAEAWPPDFTLRLEQVRRRGARLVSLDAFRTHRPVIRRGRRADLLADPAWEPLHEQFLSFSWESFVSAPLLVRDSPVGALNAYYRPGHDPDDDEIAFLTAMAGHAAVAVENARLLAESRGRATLDERQRLARELHDSACQQLFSMTLHLRAAELTAREQEETRATLRTVQQLAHAALEDLRALIVELYPTLLHSEGLVAVVQQQAASAATRLGMSITVDAPPERLDIDPEAELDAHRLVQEALHNATKHAPGAAVDIRIGPDPDDGATLLLEVADDGPGFDPSTAGSGLGLISMRERAERLGGQLSIVTAPGGGTVVRAVVPRVLGHSR